MFVFASYSKSDFSMAMFVTSPAVNLGKHHRAAQSILFVIYIL